MWVYWLLLAHHCFVRFHFYFFLNPDALQVTENNQQSFPKDFSQCNPSELMLLSIIHSRCVPLNKLGFTAFGSS